MRFNSHSLTIKTKINTNSTIFAIDVYQQKSQIFFCFNIWHIFSIEIFVVILNFDFFVNKHVDFASYDINIFALYYLIVYLAIATITQKHCLFVSNNFFLFVFIFFWHVVIICRYCAKFLNLRNSYIIIDWSTIFVFFTRCSFMMNLMIRFRNLTIFEFWLRVFDVFRLFCDFFFDRINLVEMRFYKKLLLKISCINSCTNLISICLIFKVSLMNKIELRSLNKNDSNLMSFVEKSILLIVVLKYLWFSYINIVALQ